MAELPRMKYELNLVPVPFKPAPVEVSKTACRVCGKEPQVMAFRGTGVCSELCRKERDGDQRPFRPTA